MTYTNNELALTIDTILVDFYGFKKKDNSLVCYEGSISNFKKITIYNHPSMQTSVADNQDYLCYYVTYEESSEPGYLEIDHVMCRSGYVKVERIFEYLKQKGFRSSYDWKRMYEERIAQKKEVR